jgi:hypothetical protein
MGNYREEGEWKALHQILFWTRVKVFGDPIISHHLSKQEPVAVIRGNVVDILTSYALHFL